MLLTRLQLNCLLTSVLLISFHLFCQRGQDLCCRWTQFELLFLPWLFWTFDPVCCGTDTNHCSPVSIDPLSSWPACSCSSCSQLAFTDSHHSRLACTDSPSSHLVCSTWSCFQPACSDLPPSILDSSVSLAGLSCEAADLIRSNHTDRHSPTPPPVHLWDCSVPLQSADSSKRWVLWESYYGLLDVFSSPCCSRSLHHEPLPFWDYDHEGRDSFPYDKSPPPSSHRRHS